MVHDDSMTRGQRIRIRIEDSRTSRTMIMATTNAKEIPELLGNTTQPTIFSPVDDNLSPLPARSLSESLSPSLSMSVPSSSTEESDHDQQQQQGGTESASGSGIALFGAVANLCSATLGAGVLSLPFALYQAGWIFGFLLLFLAAWSSAISIRFLVDASAYYEVYTYEGLVEHVLGRRTRRIVELCLVIFCVGCAVAYVIAVGDILQPLLMHLDRQYVIIGAWSTAMLPLSLLRRMESLQWASSIGVASIGTLLAAIIVHYWIDPSASSVTEEIYILLWPASGNATSVLLACPMVLFGFSCQVNVCAIYHELPPSSSQQNDDKTRLMHKVTMASVSMCAVLYAMISTTALLEFASNVQPNVLVNYCPIGIMRIAFGCMALAVVVAFPLNVFPARVALEGMFWSNDLPTLEDHEVSSLEEPLLVEIHEGSTDASYRCDFAPVNGPINVEALDGNDSPPDEHDDGNSINNERIAIHDTPSTKFHLFRHVLLTLGITGAALGLALLIPNISVVFGLLGGTTSSVLGFILPGLLGKSLPGQSKTSIGQAWMLIAGGTIVGVLTTIVTIQNIVSTQAGHSSFPDACDAQVGSIAPSAAPTLVGAMIE